MRKANKCKRVTAHEYCEQYVTLVDGSEGYREQFKWAVKSLEKGLGHSPVYIDEITVEVINRLVLSWKDTLSTHTIRGRRNALFRIAKVASRDENLAIRPKRLVRDDLNQVKRRNGFPQAWRPEEVAHLVATIRARGGVYRIGNYPIEGVDGPKGTPWVTAAAYWESYLLAAWDSGLRTCDLVAIKRSDIDPNGRVGLIQRKTGKPIVCSFRPVTLVAIERSFELSPDRELVWPIWGTRRPWNRMRMRILQRAGLHGRMSMTRASAGTACEINAPGSGCQFLGNSSQVFHSFYFDRRQLRDIPQPPELPTVQLDQSAMRGASFGSKGTSAVSSPDVWNQDELRRLFAACKEMPGTIGTNIPANLWWTALHRTLWNTGERVWAVMAIEREWFDHAAQSLYIQAVHSKGGGNGANYPLWPETIAAIDQLLAKHKRRRLFPFELDRSAFYSHYRKLLKRAGLPIGQQHGPQKIRRSSAAWLKDFGQGIGAQPVNLFKPWETGGAS